MHVVWGSPANADLVKIVRYIKQFDPVAAVNIATRLRDAGDALCDFPKRGRPVGRGVRQLATVYPYLIKYRVHRDSVEIVSVRHGARR